MNWECILKKCGKDELLLPKLHSTNDLFRSLLLQCLKCAASYGSTADDVVREKKPILFAIFQARRT